MLQPNFTYYDDKPESIMDLGSGYWYYNYDIQPVQEEIEGESRTYYKFIQIRMFGKPTYERCVEAIIREFVTSSQEFDLINSYNQAAFNMLSSEADGEQKVNDYVEYLNKVKEIKEKIKSDFK